MAHSARSEAIAARNRRHPTQSALNPQNQACASLGATRVRHFTSFFGTSSDAGKDKVSANPPHADERRREHSDRRGELHIPPRMAAVPGTQARVSGRVATSLRNGTEGWIVPGGSFRRKVRVTGHRCNTQQHVPWRQELKADAKPVMA